jgi:NAD(P)-dependent dehydrogenase (short-subunit alcohol dehydrogenase family)
MNLSNRIIVVTGAAQGIGEATARLCAQRGGKVYLADLKAAPGEAVAESIRKAGGDARFIQTDVSDEEQVRALMAEVEREAGRIDGMVCAAGILKGAFQQPEDLATTVYDQVIDVNLRGSFLCAKHATPLLAKAGRGVIVLLASGAGVIGASSSLAYGSSKGGVNGLGMTLASHLASRGIRVNVVCPGEIVTEMKLSVVIADAERSGRSVEEALAKARASMGSPEGVARVLAFLLSDEADHVRGTLFTR